MEIKEKILFTIKEKLDIIEHDKKTQKICIELNCKEGIISPHYFITVKESKKVNI